MTIGPASQGVAGRRRVSQGVAGRHRAVILELVMEETTGQQGIAGHRRASQGSSRASQGVAGLHRASSGYITESPWYVYQGHIMGSNSGACHGRDGRALQGSRRVAAGQ